VYDQWDKIEESSNALYDRLIGLVLEFCIAIGNLASYGRFTLFWGGAYTLL
jgi:hypothetical protein